MSTSYQSEFSYCGLMCKGCPIYMATLEPDPQKKQKMRQEIVNITNNLYNTKYTLEDITDCLGCMSDSGVLFTPCKDCKIRNCAKDRGMSSCAFCKDSPCANLAPIIKKDVDAKIRLDVMRAGMI